MLEWTDGTGQKLVNVHPKEVCEAEGHPCCIHNPSDHHMKDWPLHWRFDRRIMERICPHGVGHPDPDDFAYLLRIGRGTHESIHGCDGCCHPGGREQAMKEIQNLVNDSKKSIEYCAKEH